MVKSILIIEDDRFIGEMYVRSLKKEGYDVDWAVNGHDGMIMATNKPYDVVLLDIMLPEMRGTEVIQTLRKDHADVLNNAKIIVITNFDQDDETRQALQDSVDAYLIKAEITPRKLIDIIAHLDTNSDKPASASTE